VDLKHRSPNIIMCLLAMDGLNEVMPKTKGVKFTESVLGPRQEGRSLKQG